MTLNAEDLRATMRAWSTGVTVVTAAHEGRKHGMTVNSFTSISLDPAVIIVGLRGGSRTHELVMQSRMFGVTILSAQQIKIADIFAGLTPEVKDRFANLQTETLSTGAPLIAGGLAWLDCRVRETFNAGASDLFIAEVLDARKLSDEEPLIHHNREFWRLASL